MKNNKKTLGMIIVGLVIVFMAGIIVNLLNTNCKLSADLEDQKGAYEKLEHNYKMTVDDENELIAAYAELAEGVHNMKQHNAYKFSYYYKGKTYHYEGNGKIFGETGLITEYLNK